MPAETAPSSIIKSDDCGHVLPNINPFSGENNMNRYLLLAASALTAAPLGARAAPMLGVNIGGLEASGTYPVISTVPLTKYFSGPVQIVRLEFTMARMFPGGPGSAISTSYLADVMNIVTWDQGHGIVTVLDNHEYNNIGGSSSAVIGTAAGNSALETDWVNLVAQLPSYVVLDLDNEPNGSVTNAQLVTAYQGTINGVRNAGFTGAIAVEPTNYAGWAQVTGAGWSGFAGLNDPAGKLIFEVHGYFDSNDSGTSTNDASSTTAAASNLQNVVNFQNANGSQFIGIYLGETGPGETNNTIDATFRAVGDNVYKVISSNAADFFAVTLYGAGQEWPSSYVDNENPIPNFGSVTNAVGYQQAVNDLEPLVLYFGEDAYQGDAQATVAVDNVQVWTGAISADRLNNTSQPVGVFGALTSGTHTITVNFTNDAYGGSISTDRNLFVDGATYAGTKATADGFAPLYGNGSSTFHVTVP